MTNRRDPLAAWMTPDTSDVRVERIWAGIAEVQERRSRRVWPYVTAGAVLAAAVTAFVLWPRAQVLDVGSTVTAEAEARELKLHDGSQVSVAQESTVELLSESDSELRVALPSGSATFEVAKRPSRKFIVQAGHVEVRVVGTRFTVHHDGDGVFVSVQRGIVEVADADAVVRLTAGQTWSSQPAAAAPEPVEDEEPSVTQPQAPAVAPPHAQVSHHPHRRGTAKAPPAAAPVTAMDGKNAETLFQEALAARRAGRYAEAVVALEQIVRDHSDDARAPLAAFELGRLRMDEVSDLRGATQALELSLALAPKAQFAEEALMRLTKAYDARGLPAPCVHARDDYLARFPAGAYVESVKGLCTH
jgi:TolA-binding protein